MSKKVVKTIQEYGCVQTVSKQFKDQVDETMLKSLIEEQVIRDVSAKGYTPVDRAQFIWSTTPYTLIEDEDGKICKAYCDPEDEKALFDIACKIKVVKK